MIVMEGSKTLFFSSKFQWACKRIPSKFIENLGTHHQKDSPAVDYGTGWKTRFPNAERYKIHPNRLCSRYRKSFFGCKAAGA